MKDTRTFRRGDVLIAAVILSLAVALFLSARIDAGAASNFAILKVEDKIEAIDLRRSDRLISIENRGYHLQVEISGGAIRVKSSDCPDQICVRAGWLTSPGAAAACVPARFSIELAGEAETDALLR